MKEKVKQKPMPAIAFKAMTAVMSIRRLFRDVGGELRYAGIKPGCYFLDFGCGLGFNTIPAAKIVGPEGKVFALDISREAIEVLKKKAKKNNLENIETILSDCDTGLESNSVDIVYLHNTLPLINNKEDVLDEIHRVLKIRGRLSYMSRLFSRIAGGNSMTDEELRDYLEADNKFKLIKGRGNQFIFEKK
ncbi:MAG: class I SAM-dependent methyltransferase [Candidatus Altiarchaeota archaeon]|nr:class I SAM-dependent methyltransferase [Candidatus Altiarchaeota archaeon]